MPRLKAVAHVAPGSTIVEGTAISLPPEMQQGIASPCVPRPDFPVRLGLDRGRSCGDGRTRLGREAFRRASRRPAGLGVRESSIELPGRRLLGLGQVVLRDAERAPRAVLADVAYA